jgi:hypothetical protein
MSIIEPESFDLKDLESGIEEVKDFLTSDDIIPFKSTTVKFIFEYLDKCLEDKISKYGKPIISTLPPLRNDINPIQIKKPLVDFFMVTDLGKGITTELFQDDPIFKFFFKHGFLTFNFGMDLFNIFDTLYKLKNNTHEVKLNSKQRDIICPALNDMINKYKENNNLEDAKALEEGILKNKDYMSIISFYKSNIDENLKPYSGYIHIMEESIKDLKINITKK